MKKYIMPIFLISIITIICSGCTPETGTMTCTMTTFPTEGITLSSTYTATYEDNIVTNLQTEEQITSEEKETLEIYKEKIEEIYQDYQNLEYYENKIKLKNNTLTSTTNINYQKVNTEKLIEIDNGNASIIKNGKVAIDDLKKMYQKNGCNCKKR